MTSDGVGERAFARSIRLGTFNIQHGRGAHGAPPDAVRLERALARLDVDVLALQEVDRLQPRSRGVDQVEIAVRATGLTWVRFAPTLLGDVRSAGTRTPAVGGPARASARAPSAGAPAPPSVGAPAQPPVGAPAPAPARAPAPVTVTPGYGVALLSRYPVLAWFVAPLPGARGPCLVRRARHPVRRDAEPRVCLAAVVRAPHGLLVVASAHLTRTPRVAVRQLDVALRGLVTLADRSGGSGGTAVPAVLLGDLNLRCAAVAAVCARQRVPVAPLAPARTHPAIAPRRQLDHVLGLGPVRPAAPAAAPRLDTSDHRPLTVEVLAGPA